MAKDRKKLQHIHSSVPDKQPTPATLEVGEIAVNNSKDQEFLSIKNSEDRVVRFSSDEQLVTIMEKKEVMPYVGYVRGETGPSATSADTPTKDEYGSYGVTNNDLLNNTSNIIIKLNQVAAGNTIKHNRVNGAKDRYNKLVNPTTDNGVTDGAGFFIDMSRYAMQGANPEFSGITNTCYTELNGRTEILGGTGTTGDCRSYLHIDTLTAETKIGSAKTNITTATTTIGKNDTVISGNTTLKVSGTTTNTYKGNVTVNNNANKSETTNGNLTELIKGYNYHDVNGAYSGTTGSTTTEIKVGNVTESNSGTTTIDRKGDVSINNQNNVTEVTSGNSTTTIIGTAKTSATTADYSGDTLEINESISISAKAPTTTLSGTNFNVTETDTTINSCGKVEINTDKYILRQCNNSGGTADFEFCNGYTVKSNKITLSACSANNGEINIAEKTINISGGTLTSTTTGDTNINVGGKLTEKVTGNTSITVSGSTTLSSEDGTTINTTSGNTNINTTGNTCIVSTKTAAFVGTEKTNIGKNCSDGGQTATLNINGTTINETGTTVNISGGNNVNVTANGAGGNVTIHANDTLCESAKTVSIFASDGGKLTIGGNSCAGNTGGTYPITYIRRPKAGTCEIHSTTIDDALDEVYDRSRISLTSTAHTTADRTYTAYTIHQDSGTCDASVNFTVNGTLVSMSAETYPASSEMLKKYTFWQYLGTERKEIGVIDIPKDHILKDVSIVNGKLNGSSFTPCPTGDNTCSWFIKLVWNVFDPSTGHADDKVVYLPADDLVKDIDENNTNTGRGVNVDVWYDGKKNQVSATTKVTIKNANGTGTKEFSRANGFHTLNSYTLKSVSGDVKTNNAATNWTYDPFDKQLTITAATDASHINRKTLSWRYGDVKSAIGGTYDPGDGTVNTMGSSRTMEFVIPTCVNHLNRHKITFSKGSVSAFTSQTYDPGKDCDNTAETINIPTSIDELSNWNGTCISLPHNVCVDGTVTASGAVYSSDRRLKENIRELTDHDLDTVERIKLKKFNFISDKSKTTTYGVIAQELRNIGMANIVHTNDEGYYGVDYTSLFILEIASLKREIQRLKNRVSELEKDKNQ